MNDTTTKPKKPAPKLEHYPHRVTEIVRFADLDPQGHVNNAVFATYFESGRVALFRKPDLGIGVPGATFVLVRQEIDFLRELRWPGNITVATALAELGRSSFVMTQAIFSGEECAGAGRATLVMVDAQTRRPTPLTAEAIAMLEPWKFKRP